MKMLHKEEGKGKKCLNAGAGSSVVPRDFYFAVVAFWNRQAVFCYFGI